MNVAEDKKETILVVDATPMNEATLLIEGDIHCDQHCYRPRPTRAVIFKLVAALSIKRS